MANGKIKGKQIEDSTISLDKLSGAGSVTIGSASAIQITGTATNPNDIVTFKQISDIGGSITVNEFGGASYSNVEQITFRGGTVRTTDGGSEADADAVLVGPGSGPTKVVVWIPAPSYTDYLTLPNPGYTQRYIAEPTSEGTPYYVGSLTTSTTENVTRSNITYNPAEFGYYDDTATFSITVFDYSDTSILDRVIFSMSELGTWGGTTSGTGSIVVTLQSGPEDDADRRKADISITINPNVVRSNGGQLRNEIIFKNTEPGGAGSATLSTPNQIYFFDPDKQGTAGSTGSSENANFGVTATFSVSERTITPKNVSGVTFYAVNSTFTFSVTDIDDLNDRSYPNGTQMDIDTTSNFRILMSGANSGKDLVQHSEFGGWTKKYNVQNLTFEDSFAINQTGQLTPGYGTNNTINSGNLAVNATADLIDWDDPENSITSNSLNVLIDTTTATSTDTVDRVNDESKRLDWSNLTYNSGSWDSTAKLSNGDLQVLFDRIIYPQQDFQNYLPSTNSSTNPNYGTSQPTTVSRSYNIINDINNSSAPTTSQNLDYCWYYSHFFVSSGMKTGYFTFDTNADEVDLEYQDGLASSTGNNDLVILLGIDDSTPNNSPNKWLWLTGQPNNWPGRNDAPGRNLDDNNQIGFTLDQISAKTRFWIAIGYKNTTRGNNIRFNEITITKIS